MPNGKKNGKPTIVGAVKKKVKEIAQGYLKRKKARKLMEDSLRKKTFAFEQEKIGRAQIKNKVEFSLRGYPIGKQRLAIAAKARTEAKRDSARAVKLNPALIKKKK